jgi:hypothetical protein
VTEKGELRKAFEAITSNLKELDSSIVWTFGRRNAAKHGGKRHVKFIPIGGPVERASRTAGKQVPGANGKIEPGPTAKLTQPDVDTRKSECALRTPQLLILCVASADKNEEDGIDEAESLLKQVIIAAKNAYNEEVTLESERWLVQDQEAAGWGISGEAVQLMLSFKFPVVHQSRPLIRIAGFQQTCKLDNTLEAD